MALIQELKKHFLVLFSIAFFFFLIVGYLFYNNVSKKDQDVYDFLPNNPVLLLRVDNPEFLASKLRDKTSYWETLNDFENINFFDDVFLLIDKASKSGNAKIESIFSEPAYLSLYEYGNQNYDYLFAIDLKENYSYGDLKELLQGEFKEIYYRGSKDYEGGKIETIKIKKHTFHYTIVERFLFISRSNFLIENIIRKRNPIYSLGQTKTFKDLEKRSQKSAQANLFLNYAYLSDYLRTKTKGKGYTLNSLFSNFSAWTHLDISFKEHHISFYGLTKNNDEKKNFLSSFEKMSARENRLMKYMPYNTFCFLFYSFGSPEDFQKQFYLFLESNDRLFEHQGRINSVNKKYKNQDFGHKLFSSMEKELAIFSVDWKNKKEQGVQNYLIMRPKDINQALRYIDEIAIDVADVKKSVVNHTQYSNYLLKQLNLTGIYRILLGEPFSFVRENYVAVIEDYLIFAENRQALVNLINDFINKKTLVENPEFTALFDLVSDDSNIQAFVKFPDILNSLFKYVSDNTKTTLRDNRKAFNNKPSMMIQFENSGNYFNTSAILRFMDYKTQNSKRDFVWKTKIGNAPNTPPYVIYNHKKRDKMVVVQNRNNELLMIDLNGNIFKRIQVKEKILSPIYELRIYGRKKVQIGFGTENFIYVYDMNGDKAPGFPVRLPQKASVPLSILDYSKNRNYRFFVPLIDGSITLINGKGKKRSGWKMEKAQSRVVRPIQHFRVRGKDYILIALENGDVKIVNPLGKEIVKVKRKFEWSLNNRFSLDRSANNESWVTTDKTGSIVRIFLDGTIRTGSLTNVSENHFFTLGNYNNSGAADYFISDYNKLEIYEKANRLFQETFENGFITSPPLLFESQKGLRVGINSSKKNTTYLYRKDGSLEKGFPLYGSTEFLINDFIKNNGSQELIIAGNDGNLYLYQVP